MSERGVFAVDRGIWDHDLLSDDEPFSRREAWMWLVSEAAWKKRSVRVGGAGAVLERGQLSHSIRFIARAWNWSKSNVARFLDSLEHEAMIGTELVHGQTIITICKYDEYQRVSLPDRESVGTAMGQQRDKQEDTKPIEQYSVAKATGADAPADPEKVFFLEGKQLLGKNAGGQLTRLLRSRSGDVAACRKLLEIASGKENPAEYVAAAIARGPPTREPGGFAGVLLDQFRERNEPDSNNIDVPAIEPPRQARAC